MAATLPAHALAEEADAVAQDARRCAFDRSEDVVADDAKRLNVFQIFGWNDSVIEYMKYVIEQRK